MKPEVGMPCWYYTAGDGGTVRRPAVIVQEWGDTSGEDKANLVVTIDGTNDEWYGFSPEECGRCSAWRTSVKRSETLAPKPGTWTYRVPS